MSDDSYEYPLTVSFVHVKHSQEAKSISIFNEVFAGLVKHLVDERLGSI